MATVNEKMPAIAEAIRDKTGTTDKLSLDGMAQAIPEVYGQGKQTQYDEFWDSMQFNGTRKNHESAFVYWQDKMFYPKYDLIIPSGGCTANHMFYYFNSDIWYEKIPFNLSERLKECNVVLDTSQATGFNYTFASSGITHIPEISTVNATTLQSTFYGASKLQTIESLILKADGSQTFSAPFNGCSSLENIMIGNPRKGATCSELITMPYNEAFEEPNDSGIFIGFKQDFVDTYSEYFNKDNTYTDDAFYTCICFETGEKRQNAYYYPAKGWKFEVPSWWIPEDKTQPVSFYLAKNQEDAFTREAIGNNINFKDCPLSRKSIGCVVSALLSSVTGKTLTLKKSAVKAAFTKAIDWDMLVASKSNEYNGNWTISLV